MIRGRQREGGGGGDVDFSGGSDCYTQNGFWDLLTP